MTTETIVCPWCPMPTPVKAGGNFCVEHEGEAEARARREREAEVQQNRREWLAVIGVPRAQHGFTFSSLDETRPVQIVKAYRPLVFHGRALVLLGPTGVGKTAASVALLDSMLPDFQTRQRYDLGMTLMRHLHDFDTCDGAMDRCARARLLVIDDLPRHRDDERVAGLIDEILIIRESERRATIIISNVTPKSLTTLLSDRVMDRLKTWGNVHSVTGPSLRRAPEGKEA